MHAWECMYISVLCACFSVALSVCCQKPHSQDNRIQLYWVIHFASLLGVRITVLESTFNDSQCILHPSQKKHMIDWEWWRTVCKPLVTMWWGFFLNCDNISSLHNYSEPGLSTTHSHFLLQWETRVRIGNEHKIASTCFSKKKNFKPRRKVR